MDICSIELLCHIFQRWLHSECLEEILELSWVSSNLSSDGTEKLYSSLYSGQPHSADFINNRFWQNVVKIHFPSKCFRVLNSPDEVCRTPLEGFVLRIWKSSCHLLQCESARTGCMWNWTIESKSVIHESRVWPCNNNQRRRVACTESTQTVWLMGRGRDAQFLQPRSDVRLIIYIYW